MCCIQYPKYNSKYVEKKMLKPLSVELFHLFAQFWVCMLCVIFIQYGCLSCKCMTNIPWEMNKKKDTPLPETHIVSWSWFGLQMPGVLIDYRFHCFR